MSTQLVSRTITVNNVTFHRECSAHFSIYNAKLDAFEPAKIGEVEKAIGEPVQRTWFLEHPQVGMELYASPCPKNTVRSRTHIGTIVDLDDGIATLDNGKEHQLCFTHMDLFDDGYYWGFPNE